MGVAFLLLLVPQDPATPISRLGDEAPAVRDEAARSLRAMGESVLPALKLAADAPDAESRGRIRDLIDRIEGDGAVDPGLLARYPGLRDAFVLGDWERIVEIVRNRRSGIQGYRGDFEAYGIRLLDHPDVHARKAGSGLLGCERGVSRRPVRILVREIARWDPAASLDEHGSWLSGLASKVYSLASPLDRELLAGTRAGHPEAERFLSVLRARHGVPDAETALPGLVEHGSSQVSWMALRCVADLKYGPARPQVLRRLRSREGFSSVSGVVQAIEDDTCRRTYAEIWRSTAPRERTREHVRLLVRSGAPETVGELLGILESGPSQFLYDAAEGLAELGVHEAVDLLVAPKAPPDQRSHFVRCAARIVDAGDVSKLVEVLADPDEGVRHNARWELITVKRPELLKRLVELLVSERRPVLRDRLFDVVKTCLADRALVGSVPDETLEAIVREGELNAAYTAAELLIRRKGRDAVPGIETTIFAIGEKRSLLLKLLVDHPSDRLAAAAAAWLEGEMGAYAVIPYLEKAGTPAATSALERAAKGTDGRIRESAAEALARLRGDPPPPPDLEGLLGRSSWVHFIDRLAADEPGAREEVRRKVKEGWIGSYLKALGEWAHPEMIPALKLGLLRWDEGLAERVRWEGAPGTCLISGDEIYGSDWIRALAATGDRSLATFFVERLADPDEGVRSVAIRTAGHWGLREAVPMLRRLVRSGDFEVRAEALEALARIAAPGTKEFILEVLRDNPHAAPHALARLGAADAVPAIARLLEDPGSHAAVLSALDFLSHPGAYAGIDRPLPRRRLGEAGAAMRRFQEILPTPIRCAPGVSVGLDASCDGSFRGALEWLTGMHRTYGEPAVTHRLRDGAIEFCAVPEARAPWLEGRRQP